MADMDTPDRKPWDKLPTETAKSHRAFKIYCDLGPDRSVVQAAFDMTVGARMAYKWSRTHAWVSRASAWDAHVSAIGQAQKERVARIVAEKWAARQLEAAEKAWDTADKLDDWANEVFEGVNRKGSIGTIIKVFFAAGVTRERALLLALQATLEDDGFDPLTASPDQLRAYLAKKGVKPQSQA